jgi:hypothetical protein
MQRTRPEDSVPGSAYVGKIKQPEDADLKHLKPLTWVDVRTFAEERSDKAPFHSDRLNALPELIARAHVEGADWWVIPVISGWTAGELAGVATKRMSSRRAILLRGSFAPAGFFVGKEANSLLLNAEKCKIQERWKDLLCLNE